MTFVGRFAPSPTGHLHLGSLTTAVASFCHIKSIGGQWLLRIEDTDFERCKDDHTTSILTDLENLGLYSDQSIIYQSKRMHIYQEFLDNQLATLSYPCQCSRKILAQYSKPNTISHQLYQTQDLYAPAIYPQICLHTPPSLNTPHKIRLMLPDVYSAFYDDIYGVIWDNPAKSLGDVVIKRQNGMINYILACAIDDGLQGVTHLVRGLDILPMTVAQLFILKVCQLPVPQYFCHLPLLHNPNGQKLSKQNLATPIDTSTPHKSSKLLVQALTLLGQNTPTDMANGTPSEILDFASKHWNHTPLRHKSSLGVVS